MKNDIRIATCQFPISEDIICNARYIKRYIKKASANNACVIHFPECALSGYGSQVIPRVDWKELKLQLNNIQVLAHECEIWVLLGSYHRETGKSVPFNSVYIISDKGEITGRYDKQKIYGREARLGLCQAGNHFETFALKGMKCGILICYDSCFPELYDAYRKKGVELLFHSYYNAGNEGSANSLDKLMSAQISTRAADNGMWISASNSSLRHSRIASGVVSPDGVIRGLKRHVPGILYHDFPDNDLGWTYDNRENR